MSSFVFVSFRFVSFRFVSFSFRLVVRRVFLFGRVYSAIRGRRRWPNGRVRPMRASAARHRNRCGGSVRKGQLEMKKKVIGPWVPRQKSVATTGMCTSHKNNVCGPITVRLEHRWSDRTVAPVWPISGNDLIAPWVYKDPMCRFLFFCVVLR